MEKKLNIYFTTDNKKTYHITLAYPKDDLSKATVAAVAQKIVDTRVLNNDGKCQYQIRHKNVGG